MSLDIEIFISLKVHAQFSMYDWNIVNSLAFRKPHMILLLSNSIFKLLFYQTIIVLHAKT